MRPSDVIRNKDNWTKGFLARDKDNARVSVQDPNACKFCLQGAIYKAIPDNNPAEEEVQDQFMHAVYREVRRRYPELDNEVVFNDCTDTKHEDVLSVLEAVESCFYKGDKLCCPAS